DKTGTLTKGVFKVTRISPAVTAASADAADSAAYTVAATTDISAASTDISAAKADTVAAKAELLRFAALAEKNSIHPIAHSILEAYGRDMSAEAIESHLEIPGSGVKAVSGGKIILAGNLKLMESEGIRTASLDSGAGNCGSEGSTVHVAVDGRYLGSIIVSDELKTDAEAAVKGLRSLGVKRLVMLTGDSDSAAKSVAEALKLDEYHVGLLPEQKAGLLEDIRRKASGKVLFAGDGINDAPVLALADIGVSMGSLGSGAAVEASDIVLMKDEPSSLIPAIQIARITKSIAVQNIVFALGIKAIVLVLGAAGLANMWEAVFADVGVAVLAILNSLRVMSKRLG
ncbi:MAG: HAD-IC family P-type ATPase, partial [Clostridiales bacterium]|nr:HAD-IC family P-type ATPase [Clostridiales bacterium]